MEPRRTAIIERAESGPELAPRTGGARPADLAGVAASAARSARASVSLRVHTHVREDVIALYGFNSSLELDLFERLISISGIGPKLGLAVLSGIEPADLVRAIRTQDVARLTAIPGVGKKTAERIGLELKDRLPAALQPADAATGATAEDQLRADLVSALLNLGYHRAAAEKGIDKVLKRLPDPNFEDALRQTLRELMKG